jgi:hypothetical protein
MPTLAYCATLNNYTPEEVAHLRNGKDVLQYFVAGYEIGEEGTPHLQIYFQLKKQVRITTMHKWPGWERMAKIQPARGTSDEAAGYCKKDANFFEVGEIIAHGKKGERNDLNDVKQAIDEGMTYDEVCDKYFGTAAKYHRFIREQIQARDAKKAKDSLREELESLSLRPWQMDLVAAVKEPAHHRKIYWIWSTEGDTGKSTTATYLGVLLNALVLELGKKTDLYHIFAKKPEKIVVFDLTRTTEGLLDGLYSMAEQLKNCRLTSGKFDGETVYFQRPHVIFFANFGPAMDKWSQDRYLIWKI